MPEPWKLIEQRFQADGDKYVGSSGATCERRGDYAVCTAPWWPFRWILEPVFVEEIGEYGIRAIFCPGFDDDDPRCRE